MPIIGKTADNRPIPIIGRLSVHPYFLKFIFVTSASSVRQSKMSVCVLCSIFEWHYIPHTDIFAVSNTKVMNINFKLKNHHLYQLLVRSKLEYYIQS